jgi:hypothetical protein
MSNPLFSHDADDASDPTLDPTVDAELRDFVQRFSIGPTAEEQARFWDDLSKKLPEQKVPAHVFAQPTPSRLKRYLPWTALASGLAVVLLLLVQPGEKFTHQAALSERAEGQRAPAAESLDMESSHLNSPASDAAGADSKAEPMVLGAAPVAKRVQKEKPSEAPFGLANPDFDLRWEKLSEKVFLIHIAPQDRDPLQNLAKDWPSGLVLTQVTESSGEKKEVYRLEDKR